MLPLILFFLSLIIFSVQTAFLKPFSFGGVTPDLILILTVYCAIHFKESSDVGMGCALGVVQDCLSGGLLGINTLSKGLIAFFFSVLKNKIEVDSLLPICFFLWLASLFDVFVFYFVWNLLLKDESSGSHLFPNFLIYAGYNALVGPLLFFVFNLGKKFLIRRFPNQVFRPL